MTTTLAISPGPMVCYPDVNGDSEQRAAQNDRCWPPADERRSGLPAAMGAERDGGAIDLSRQVETSWLTYGGEC